MFFLLSKALLFLISPFVWMITAVLIYFFPPKNSWKKPAIRIGLVVFLLFTNTAIYLEFMRKWEVHGTPISKVGQHDVGIVLGGMTEYNSDLKTLSIRRGGDRIWQAISLYKAHKIKKILISGDNGYVSDRGLHEAQQLKEVLINWGIPSNDIIAETKSKNTYENAQETAKILRRSYPHLNTKLLITSGRHMKRALACFEKADVLCTPFSTDLFSGPTRNYHWDQYIIPDSSTLLDWNELLREWVGYFTYWITGKI
jgi:uncharacterized SAM-binding protein YcdF (DUF218 family)